MVFTSFYIRSHPPPARTPKASALSLNSPHISIRYPPPRNLHVVQREIERLGVRQHALRQKINNARMQQQELEMQFEFESLTQRRAFGPIMIITFKNHALDEYLLDCLQWIQDPAQGNMVRLGAGSLSEELRKYNLNEYVKVIRILPGLCCGLCGWRV